MTTKDLLKKRLLLALTCTMSIQMFCVVHAWAESPTTDVENSQQTSSTVEVENTTTNQEQNKQEEVVAPSDLMKLYRTSAADGISSYALLPTIVMGEDLLLKSLSLGTGSTIGSSANAIAIGNSSQVSGSNSVAIGSSSQVSSTNSITIGNSSQVSGSNSIAIGYGAKVAHSGSIALGANSSTSADNQVSFGSYEDSKWTRRSIAGVSNLDMAGALTGVTTLNGVTISGSTAAGLTIDGVNFRCND